MSFRRHIFKIILIFLPMTALAQQPLFKIYPFNGVIFSDDSWRNSKKKCLNASENMDQLLTSFQTSNYKVIFQSECNEYGGKKDISAMVPYMLSARIITNLKQGYYESPTHCYTEYGFDFLRNVASLMVNEYAIMGLERIDGRCEDIRSIRYKLWIYLLKDQ